MNNEIEKLKKLKVFNSKPAINFYFLSYYSLYIDNKNNEILEKRKRLSKISTIDNKFICRSFLYTITSLALVKNYKSLLILPIFYLNISLINSFLIKTNCEDCIFCKQREIYEKNKIKYKLVNELYKNHMIK